MRQSAIIAGIALTCNLAFVQAQILDDVLGSVTDSISDITDEVLPGITNIRVGIGPVISPDYEGSDDYKISAAPLISLRYKDVLRVDNNHIRVNILGSESLIANEKFKAGPSLSLDFGRNETDNVDLYGLGNIGTGIELGIFASYQEGPTRARIRVRKDVANGHDGMEIIGDFRILLWNRNKLTIVTTLSGSWGDSSYMDAYFGITPEQSLASGLPEFETVSDFKDMSLNLSTNYQINKKWAFVANGSYKKLMGDARDSPVVSLRGSADQFFGGVFAVYSF